MSFIQEFDYSVNILRSILWRNNESVNIISIANNKQDAINTLNAEYWTDWFDDVFNLQTANSFGLTVWSIILGISISVSPDPDFEPNSNWGFGEFRKNFENGNFTDAQDPIVLTPEQARLVLRLRYYQLVTRATVTECNAIMNEVFGSGVYVLDGLNMTMAYVFENVIPDEVLFVLEQYDILPRPAGVGLSLMIDPTPGVGYGEFRINYNNAGYGA